MPFMIPFERVKELLEIQEKEFPKYTRQLINLANQNSGGTRPRVVGPMIELIIKANPKSLEEWREWYKSGHPNAIAEASNKIEHMILHLKLALNKITRQMIEEWVEDLVVDKTMIGYCFQSAIFKDLSERLGLSYRSSTSAEESKGIDGFLGDLPVQIKPSTYDKTKRALNEIIKCPIVYYTKEKNGLKIEEDELLKALETEGRN